MSELDVADNFFTPWVRYHKAFTLYRSLHVEPRSTFDTLHIWYGVTGAGKSYLARSTFPGAYWTPGGKDEWYDGYDGQKCIVIDELDPHTIPIRRLLRLANPYPLKLQVKGGFVECVAQTVVITHNEHPHTWYPHAGERSVAALMQRATLRFFGVQYTPPVGTE